MTKIPVSKSKHFTITSNQCGFAEQFLRMKLKSSWEPIIRIELRPNQMSTRTRLGDLQRGETWTIEKAVCLDREYPDFNLELCLNGTPLLAVRASMLKPESFSIRLNGPNSVDFVATPFSPVTSLTIVSIGLKVRKGDRT